MATVTRSTPTPSADTSDPAMDAPCQEASAPSLLAYGTIPVLVGVATLLAAALERATTISNLSLVFVLPVIAAGALIGLGPALFGAVLSALSFNFFFTEPRWTLQVDDPANIWAIGLLTVVGCVASALTATAQRRGATAERRKRHLSALHGFSRDVAGMTEPTQMRSQAMNALERLFAVPLMIVTVDADGQEVVCARGAIAPDPASIEAARSALVERRLTPAFTYPFDESRFFFWPVKAGGFGVAIGLAFEPNERPDDAGPVIETLGCVLALNLAKGRSDPP